MTTKPIIMQEEENIDSVTVRRSVTHIRFSPISNPQEQSPKRKNEVIRLPIQTASEKIYVTNPRALKVVFVYLIYQIDTAIYCDLFKCRILMSQTTKVDDA